MFTKDRFCAKCGKALPKPLYCADCGKNITPEHRCGGLVISILSKDHDCHPPIRHADKYCSKCGKAFPKPQFCTACGKDITPTHWCNVEDMEPVHLCQNMYQF